ncbi:MAG: SCO family protein [Leptospirales bacterium]
MNSTHNPRGDFLGARLLTLFLATSFLTVGCDRGQESAPEFPKELSGVSLPREGVPPFFKGAILDPYWPAASVRRSNYPADLRRLDNFIFTAHDSKRFDDARLDGKYTLVSFFFARCSGICPMITFNMRKVSKRIRRQSDLQLLSITVNPDEDDPAALDKYRRNNQITQPNWFFVTGPRVSIYEAAREQFGADVQTVNGRDSLTDFVHTENVFLLDRDGFLRGVYRARGMGDLERLLTDLEALREIDRRAPREKTT